MGHLQAKQHTNQHLGGLSSSIESIVRSISEICTEIRKKFQSRVTCCGPARSENPPRHSHEMQDQRSALPLVLSCLFRCLALLKWTLSLGLLMQTACLCGQVPSHESAPKDVVTPRNARTGCPTVFSIEFHPLYSHQTPDLVETGSSKPQGSAAGNLRLKSAGNHPRSLPPECRGR